MAVPDLPGWLVGRLFIHCISLPAPRALGCPCQARAAPLTEEREPDFHRVTPELGEAPREAPDPFTTHPDHACPRTGESRRQARRHGRTQFATQES